MSFKDYIIPILIVSLLCLICFSFSFFETKNNFDNVEKILTEQGYTNIDLDGYDFFGCGQEDIYRTKFIATNSNNKTVEGTVCCGFFKKCTIRW
jgi:hypothetical protein